MTSDLILTMCTVEFVVSVAACLYGRLIESLSSIVFRQFLLMFSLSHLIVVLDLKPLSRAIVS